MLCFECDFDEFVLSVTYAMCPVSYYGGDFEFFVFLFTIYWIGCGYISVGGCVSSRTVLSFADRNRTFGLLQTKSNTSLFFIKFTNSMNISTNI